MGRLPLHSCRSTLAPRNDPSIFSGILNTTTTSTLNVTGVAAANVAVVNTLAVEAKTTFKGLVDFSNSYIPTLPVDGNLTADDAVMNNLAVEAKTTFKGHVDFSNSFIPTLPVDGNLTADDADI